MRLLLLAYVASAAASEQCQEQSHTHSPHLHKRDWHEDPAANLAFGKGKHRSTLYVLDETSVTAVELPGTRGARVGRERKFDVGRVRYKST